VEKLIDAHCPDRVVIEDLYVRQPKIAILLARFSGVIIELSGRKLRHCPDMLACNKARSILGIPNKKEDAFEYIKNRFKGITKDWTFSEKNDIADSLIVGLAILKEENDDESGRKKAVAKRKTG
jgi:Holliday junction resolvasome RuvABC endonuclease subunit